VLQPDRLRVPDQHVSRRLWRRRERLPGQQQSCVRQRPAQHRQRRRRGRGQLERRLWWVRPRPDQRAVWHLCLWAGHLLQPHLRLCQLSLRYLRNRAWSAGLHPVPGRKVQHRNGDGLVHRMPGLFPRHLLQHYGRGQRSRMHRLPRRHLWHRARRQREPRLPRLPGGDLFDGPRQQLQSILPGLPDWHLLDRPRRAGQLHVPGLPRRLLHQ